MHIPITSFLVFLPLLATANPLEILFSNETTPTSPIIYPPPNPTLPDPDYNTSYPGPVHAHEWDYYMTQYSPDWFHANCDAITGTSCLCSTARKGGLYNHIASYTSWSYYSRFHNKTYAMHKICGPVAPATADHEDHCWRPTTGTWCTTDKGDGQEMCMDWGVEGKKWITLNGHKRNFDYDGIFT